MKKNQLFIIIGVLIFSTIIFLLIWMQSFQGNAEELEKKYTITIHNCDSIFKDTIGDFKEEMKAFLSSTELKNDGSFLTPILKVDKSKVSFGIPLYGMNSMRYSMNPDMYLSEDRLEDEREFFENDFKNPNFEIMKKTLMRAPKQNVHNNVKTNFKDTFLIDRSLDKSKDSTWNSMKSLRADLNLLIKNGKVKENSTIHIYFLSSIPDEHKISTEVIEEPKKKEQKVPDAPKPPKASKQISPDGNEGNNTFKISYENRKISWVGSNNVSFDIRIMADGTNVFQQVVKNNSVLTINKKIYKTITQSADIEIQYFDPSAKTWKFLAKTKCENLK
jgi:hypothetical protein